MTRDEFDDYCASLAATTHVIQWGNASVWKVGGKIFAICSNWGKEEKEESEAETGRSSIKISFKVSDLAYEILPEQPGIIPAPYLARAKWVQLEQSDAMADEEIRAHIKSAHQIISRKLTKKLQKQLGLNTIE
ncbi:MAG: MmcQ/YjbR family DNA-binding protein [Cohaesibacter sp.]|nr:MmcQ/YjbR family DNA-binding protein [Cohaesibacter sp.]